MRKFNFSILGLCLIYGGLVLMLPEKFYLCPNHGGGSTMSDLCPRFFITAPQNLVNKRPTCYIVVGLYTQPRTVVSHRTYLLLLSAIGDCFQWLHAHAASFPACYFDVRDKTAHRVPLSWLLYSWHIKCLDVTKHIQ